jgi:nucleoside recognition membrane protein YjiH
MLECIPAFGTYGKYLCKNKDSAVYRYYQEDSVLHPLFYLLGSIFALILVLHYTFPAFEGPAAIVSPGIGETVYSIAMDVAWIIPVSAVFMPFLLNYGIVDFIGSLMEPVFKIPGRSAVNAIASFVSSASVGVLITSKLYQRGIYTKKEAALIATGFSAVSVGFAYKVIETADLSEYFLPIYFIALLVTLIVSFFMARIPPLSRKASVFADGRQQTKEEIQAERVPARAVLKTGASRAVKKAATAPGLFKEIRSSLLDSCYVLPKVISLLTAVGIIAMLIAAYTPVFNWIGKLFAPLLVLLQVPNAAEIAPALPVGIAEMFLPVLMIADKVGTLAVGARYMVVTVSMVQIIFFSETIVVMMSTKIPVSLKELIICFFERTIVAIPISALFMHLLF